MARALQTATPRPFSGGCLMSLAWTSLPLTGMMDEPYLWAAGLVTSGRQGRGP